MGKSASPGGYVDPYDSALYKEAHERFWRDVRAYNVTATRCELMCGLPDRPYKLWHS